MTIKIEIDENLMNQAIKEAKIAKSMGELPFGAIIVCKGEIIGRGHAETTKDPTFHAELLAIQKACLTLNKNNLNDCTIYCTNEPCAMCSSAIFQSYISRVVIGASRVDLPNFFEPGKVTIENLAQGCKNKIEIIRGILKDKIIPLFEDVVKDKGVS